MARALIHHLHPKHGAAISVLAWLRGWIATWRQIRAAAQAPTLASTTMPPVEAPHAVAQVLAFPIRGEALLVKLAEKLRDRIGQRTWTHNPLLLVLSRRPHSRLTIDRDTYIEFDTRRVAFRAVIDAAPDTRLTIDTADFDAVVSFVVQYVNDRLSDAVPLEVAS